MVYPNGVWRRGCEALCEERILAPVVDGMCTG
jgi:hypothetical protein